MEQRAFCARSFDSTEAGRTSATIAGPAQPIRQQQMIETTRWRSIGHADLPLHDDPDMVSSMINLRLYQRTRKLKVRSPAPPKPPQWKAIGKCSSHSSEIHNLEVPVQFGAANSPFLWGIDCAFSVTRYT
jgi:hypothetical protein